MSTGELRRDLECLLGLGGQFLTLEDLRAGAQPAPDAPNFVISFDDGFRDTYENGIGVLDELGIKGVVFQIAELIDAVELNWEHALYWYAFQPHTRESFGAALKECLDSAGVQHMSRTDDMRAIVVAARDTLPVEQLAGVIGSFRRQTGDAEARARLAGELYPRAGTLRAAREGGHEVGSHGLRHVARSFLDRETFLRDVTEASALIERAAGTKPEAYAYPFGSHESGDEALLADIHRQAVITDPGPLDPSHPYTLRRCPWPGPARNELRRRRWLLTGSI